LKKEVWEKIQAKNKFLNNTQFLLSDRKSGNRFQKIILIFVENINIYLTPYK